MGLNRKQIKKRYLALICIGLFAVAGLGSFYIFFRGDVRPTINKQDTKTTEEPKEDTQKQATQINEKKTSDFNKLALQTAVDDWSATLGTDPKVGVVIKNTEGKTLASLNPSESFFTASLYKLFVAYEGYKEVDAKSVDPAKAYLNGHTRAECLDLMIRNSDSPCGEKLWTELGKENLTAKMKTYDINNTSLTGLSTTAEDTAIMLARIARGEGLSNESQSAYLSSMKDQDSIYRRGLPSGFSDQVTVYNKVGWNEQLEWHDASIIELKDGRKLVVAVLTSGIGTKKIIELGQSIENVILN